MTSQDPADLQRALAEARRLEEGLARLQQRQLAAHRATHGRGRRRMIAAAAVLLLGTAGYVVARAAGDRSPGPQVAQRQGATAGTAASPVSPSAGCTSLRVVTAASFAPVVRQVGAGLATGEPCVRTEVVVADGRTAPARVAGSDADVWIPDDLAWQAFAPKGLLADRSGGGGAAGAGSVLATSPVYMVAGRSAAARLRSAGSSWAGLARELADGNGMSLVVRDPRGSADGLVAAGAVGEGVWLRQGMDASALVLSQVFTGTRTLSARDGVGPALPRAGEIGLVPEHALLPRLDRLGRDTAILAGKDHTAMLRVGWLPTARSAADPVQGEALERLSAALRGAPAADALAAAGFRRPGATSPPGTPARRLPATSAEPFEVLEQHHVDHVFATWYPVDRRANVLIVVDVSGSTIRPAPGSDRALITVVREACRTVGRLLPAQARLGLWEFGAGLDGKRDYRVLLRPGALTSQHRRELSGALDGLIALRTNTGLYDTILAAYTAGGKGSRRGVPNQVLVFTDGRNEGDPGSISASTLRRRLAAAGRTGPETALTVLSFGTGDDSRSVAAAIRSVDGEVVEARTARDVEAAFVHLAAGGLHAD